MFEKTTHLGGILTLEKQEFDLFIFPIITRKSIICLREEKNLFGAFSFMMNQS